MNRSLPGPVSSAPSLSFSRRAGDRRPRLARLALAVTLALPAVAVLPLRADEPVPTIPATPLTSDNRPAVSLSLQPLANADLLKKGADELNNRQYEEALATLQQVQPDPNWDRATQQTFADMLAKAEQGAGERRSARAAFERGEVALAAGNNAEAIAQYRLASENRFADEGTRAKAREQMAVAENVARRTGTDLKSVYASAKADYSAGRYTDAKEKFEQLKAANYRAGLFEKSVNDYLKDTNEKLAAGFTGPGTPTPVVVAPPPEPSLPPAEAQARAEQPYQEAQARAGAEDQRKQARDAYRMGRDQYRRGDWNAARENLTLASNLGYRPGLFEDSPEKLLARMDAKEQADAARAAAEAQARAQREAAEQAARDAEAAARAAAPVEATPVEPAPVPAEMSSSVVVSPAPSESTVVVTNPEPAIPLDTTNVQPTALDPLRETVEASRAEAEQRAFQARELVQQADAAAAATKLDEALTLYSRAAELDPNNAEALAGRTRMLQLTNRKPFGRDLLEEQERQILARREAITFSFDNAIARANTSIEANDFRAATAALSEARIARAQDPTIFQTEELARFDTVLAETSNRLEGRRLAFATEQERLSSEEAATREKARLEAERAQRDATIRNLKRTARELTEQRKFTEALAVVDQIIALDPRDEYATGLRPILLDQSQFQKQRRHRDLFERQVAEALIESEEKKIPYTDILRYPENWPELSEIRDRSVEQERGASEEDQVVAQNLERKLPEINLNQVAFSDVVDFLRDVSQTNIFVNWRALEGSGIQKDTPVTARLRDVKFSKVLATILNEVGGGTVRLSYTIDEGVITISTEEDLSANVVTRVYDIRDLIINIPDFTEAPDFNLQQQQSAGRGGGGGGSLFGGGGGGGEDDEGPTRQELVDQIIQLIQDTIASESWKDNGGTVGSVRELQGQLIVTQTPENQRQLVRLLEQLRETRAIQVTIEARFLSVQRNFLEDIGVDVDFAFANLDERFLDSTPTIQNPGLLGREPGSQTPGLWRVDQNSAAFTRARNLDTNLPGNLAVAIDDPASLLGAPSLITGLTFLDDFQVRAIVRATQAAQNVTTLTAPRVTLFNGQRAYVLISTQRAYISDLTPIVGTGAAGFDPTPAFVNTGAILDVQATVSSDRKYVTLTLRPQVATLLNLRNFQVAQATAGGGTGTGGDGGDAGVATGFVQQPEIQITEVRTTVSVPDGGTLLLGGQTLAAEIERESGVPVLSKIPYLKRLFTNRSTANDNQVLLILVKPTIIIQREQEQRQFPTLSQKAQG